MGQSSDRESPNKEAKLHCTAENDEAADSYVAVYDIREFVAGDAAEGPGAQCGANSNGSQTENITFAYGRSNKAVVGAGKCHHCICYYKIGLDHSHVVHFVGLCRDKIEYCRRAVHSKETAHQATYRACSYLVRQCYPKFYALIQECEPDAYKNARHLVDFNNSSKDWTFESLQALETAVKPRMKRMVPSCISLRREIAIVEVTKKIDKMGMSLFHVMNFLYFTAAIKEVVNANSPDNAVASP